MIPQRFRDGDDAYDRGRQDEIDERADALAGYQQAAQRCRSPQNGGKCVCEPVCFDTCIAEAEANAMPRAS